MINLAVFLSGGGSNARAICSYFKDHTNIQVALLLSNKENSGTHQIAADFHLPYFIFNKEEYKEGKILLDVLEENKIDYLILAGFLWLIPYYLLKHFPDKIINIHPALLPKYGGKGMHGMHVHQAVWKNKETESGITIHLCNEHYDDGKILNQKTTTITEDDTPQQIAQKVLQLEHQYYASTIEKYINLGSEQAFQLKK